MSYLRTGGATEKEGAFGILDGLGGFFVEGALAACIAGFAVFVISFFSIAMGRLWEGILHLAQHVGWYMEGTGWDERFAMLRALMEISLSEKLKRGEFFR